jgi:hypothetical protein
LSENSLGKSIYTNKQSCGSEFRNFVDPDPYWESGSGSRGKKIKKFQWKKALFKLLLTKILPLKRYKTLRYYLKFCLMNYTGIFDLI